MEGDEYNVATDAANTFNRNMRSADSYYAINGLEIHEIEPVKMGEVQLTLVIRLQFNPKFIEDM